MSNVHNVVQIKMLKMQISPNLLEQKGKNEKQIAKGCCWRLNAVTVSDKQCLKRKMIITPEIKNLFAAARWCPKATKTGIAETQPWTYLFIAVRCNICVVWINTVCIYLLFSCTPFPSTCQCVNVSCQVSRSRSFLISTTAVSVAWRPDAG